jgi:hypothetical protein
MGAGLKFSRFALKYINSETPVLSATACDLVEYLFTTIKADHVGDVVDGKPLLGYL